MACKILIVLLLLLAAPLARVSKREPVVEDASSSEPLAG
jgi:hypothetical protein